MYKNLSCPALGVSGRQSELIELALTYRFRGMDLDILHFTKQAEHRGLDHARRFIDSAKLKIGCFELPVRWRGDEETYKADLATLGEAARMAAAIGAVSCRTSVMPACDERPYHESFEFHRQRLTEIADVLALHEIYLGLDFLAPPHYREGRQFQFIADAEALLLLIKTIGLTNVGVALDLWNWRIGGGTIDQIKSLPAHTIVEVRVADLSPDVDLEAVRDEDRLLPGEGGAIDTAGVLRTLAELGYTGPITPYPHASCFTGMTRDTIVQKTSRALAEQWTAAELTKAGTLALAAGETAAGQK